MKHDPIGVFAGLLVVVASTLIMVSGIVAIAAAHPHVAIALVVIAAVSLFVVSLRGRPRVE